jgi:hypothetical protein
MKRFLTNRPDRPYSLSAQNRMNDLPLQELAVSAVKNAHGMTEKR